MRSNFVLMLLVLLLTGCEVKDLGSSLRYKLQGEYYLQQESYSQGAETFAEALRESPSNDDALYYYGRFLLAGKEPGKAIPYLQKAVALESGNADYLFWLGVAYGEKGDREQERRKYLQTLEKDPDHVQALIYLGHNYLRTGELEKSLKNYQKALTLNPYDPQALYNRGLILRRMKREPEERLAWKMYLDFYPAGAFARRAADRLNILHDYSYRNYELGFRTVTLTEIRFLPFTSQLSAEAVKSLDLVGATLVNMGYGTLQVLVFQLNNIELARERAQSIRRYLYKKYPDLRKESRVRLSWFATAERRIIDGKKLEIDESVQFFLTDIGPARKKITASQAKKVKKK